MLTVEPARRATLRAPNTRRTTRCVGLSRGKRRCADPSCRRLVIFFFQAEDGIRDVAVTGVQTCALPISARNRGCRWSQSDTPVVGRKAAATWDFCRIARDPSSGRGRLRAQLSWAAGGFRRIALGPAGGGGLLPPTWRGGPRGWGGLVGRRGAPPPPPPGFAV